MLFPRFCASFSKKVNHIVSANNACSALIMLLSWGFFVNNYVIITLSAQIWRHYGECEDLESTVHNKYNFCNKNI